jgi:hypothetical protein
LPQRAPGPPNLSRTFIGEREQFEECLQGDTLPCPMAPRAAESFLDLNPIVRQIITKRGLSGPKRSTLNAVANYLYRNRSRMRYNEYLANGWPNRQRPGRRSLQELD